MLFICLDMFICLYKSNRRFHITLNAKYLYQICVNTQCTINNERLTVTHATFVSCSQRLVDC